jgi:2-polyprenyl-3-methyl-5-hydroxy-6-metoxy-1,4-benzoquinol methylase
MKKSINYYSKNPMVVYESFISRILNKFLDNYSREEVAAEFNLSGETCLDIACGDGELSNNFLSKKYKNVYGVDISKDLINKAKLNKAENCNFIVDDIDRFVKENIKKDKKYDSIYLLAILEHIQWPSIFLSDATKILKRGGHVVIEVPNVAWLPYRIGMIFGRFPVTAPTTGVIPGVYEEHIRFFPHETLKKISEDVGLKLVDTKCSGKFRFIKSIYYSLLSPDIVFLLKK